MATPSSHSLARCLTRAAAVSSSFHSSVYRKTFERYVGFTVFWKTVGWGGVTWWRRQKGSEFSNFQGLPFWFSKFPCSLWIFHDYFSHRLLDKSEGMCI